MRTTKKFSGHPTAFPDTTLVASACLQRMLEAEALVSDMRGGSPKELAMSIIERSKSSRAHADIISGLMIEYALTHDVRLSDMLPASAMAVCSISGRFAAIASSARKNGADDQEIAAVILDATVDTQLLSQDPGETSDMITDLISGLTPPSKGGES